MAPNSRRNRFGSPYDPKYEGKMLRPQDKKEQERREREQEQHKLRGCGDPNCLMCNPETAMRGGGRMATMSGNPFGGRPRMMGFPIDEIMMEVLTGKDGIFEQIRGEARDRASGNQPPKSYTEARKAVEGLISKAPEQSFDDIVGNDEALGLLRDAIEAAQREVAESPSWLRRIYERNRAIAAELRRRGER